METIVITAIVIGAVGILILQLVSFFKKGGSSCDGCGSAKKGCSVGSCGEKDGQ